MNTEQIIMALAGVIGVLTCAVAWLTYRVNQLTKGQDGKSLERAIRDILAHNEQYKKDHAHVISRLASLEDRMRRTIRKISTVRFDPFEGSGSGKQSFAIALLDDDGNGAIISSLHARDNVKVFAKPVAQFASPHELTEEEKRAIAGSR
jgi:hypothetical protein